MELSYLPLLKVQRDIYRMPRGMERFHEYLRTMRSAETGDLDVPLVAMNPMGKDHVPGLIDQFLSLNADEAAARAVAQARSKLLSVPGKFQATLVVSDDALGGWTNRTASEFAHCFENGPILKRGWICGILWTSEPASLESARENALKAVYRTAYILQHGQPATLAERMRQEGWAACMAGCVKPYLDPEDLAYAREVLARYREARDRATQIACLFGDAAAASLGYEAVGLSERAGFAVALADARAEVDRAEHSPR